MSEVRLNPYLNFPGNCREAFDFYAGVLQAEISFLITMGESPMANEVPAESHHHICHVCLEGEGIVLMGSDCPPDTYEKPQGTIINVQAETTERAEAIFAVLSDGGEIRMPMEETFWAERFGMCIDRFGVPWMVNCDKPMPWPRRWRRDKAVASYKLKGAVNALPESKAVPAITGSARNPYLLGSDCLYAR